MSKAKEAWANTLMGAGSFEAITGLFIEQPKPIQYLGLACLVGAGVLMAAKGATHET